MVRPMQDRGGTEAQLATSSSFGELPSHLSAVRRNWPLIAAGSVVAVVVAFVATLTLPPTFTSEAAVLLTGSKYRLELDPKFATVEQIGAGQGVPAAATRADEFRAVAQSSSV